MDQAFSDITVLDCTGGIAGPYCTKLLADFGAEVIKVEQPGEGDVTRRAGPFPDDEPHPEKSGTFFYLNTNKRSITLNLGSGKGREMFFDLLHGVDVFVEDFDQDRLGELDISTERLKAINPRLVTTSVSAFGRTGPYSGFEGTNLTLSALGGVMYPMRSPHGPKEKPSVLGGSQAGYATGLLSFIATVAGLFHTIGGEEGTRIDMSTMECVASILSPHLGEYPYIGLSRRTNPPAIHGYPIGYSLPCKDGWISFTPGIGGAPNTATLIEKPELRDDPLFSKAGVRATEPGKFDEVLSAGFKEHDKWEIATKAQALKLAAAPILSPKELLRDKQLKAREFFAEVRHPVMGDVTYPGAPAKLSVTPWRSGRAPLLGEHNEEVYGKLGLTGQQLETLREAGII